MSEEQSRWWNNKELRSSLPAIVLIIAFFGLVLFYKHGRDNISPKDAYALNVHTEGLGVALGVIITVFVIDALNRRRDERRRRQELIDRLLREVRSPNNSTVVDAIHELRSLGWLCGRNGLLGGQDLTRPMSTIFSHHTSGARLQHAPLSNANLKGANLEQANLQGAVLAGAVLDNANLLYANLQGADLIAASLRNSCLCGSNLSRSNLEGTHFNGANLERADLSQAYMRGADVVLANLNGAKLDKAFLWNASFQGANLENACLIRVNFFDGGSFKGANLKGCDLAGAHIVHCEFDESTILPDGTKWTPDVEVKRFTDPDHPAFWRSHNGLSPAHLRHEQETD